MLRKNSRLNLYWILLLLTFLPQSACAIYFKNIGVKDGLPQLSVVSLHQDVLGRIWFGTVEGLSIYDGREMVALRGGDPIFDTFIKNNTISNIVENSKHDIFFTADDALVEYKFHQNKFRRLREKGVTSVSSIRGRIYISVGDSILRWDEEQDKLEFFMKVEVPPMTINSVYQDSADNWWVATNRGLYKKKTSSWTSVIPHTTVRAIYESSSEDLWISTHAGMFKIDRNGEMKKFVHDPANPNTICCDQIRKILEDREGNLWIGTFRGLNKYSPKTDTFDVYVEGNMSGSLRHSSIHSLMLDNQGDIWVGTYYGGASTFTPSKNLFNYYPVDYKGAGRLDFHLVGNMVEDKRNNLWICTDGGGLNFMDRKSQLFHSFNMSRYNIKSDNLKCICYDPDGDRVYFAMYLNGMTCYDIRTGRFINCLNEKGNDYSHHNIRWIKMFKGKVLFLSESGMFLLNPQNGEVTPLLIENSCQYFLIDSKDYLWILHEFEIIKMNVHNTKDITRFDLKAFGIKDCQPLCICESADGGIYVGTQGSGIMEYDSQRNQFSIYTAKENGLLNDYCYNMANSSHGMLILLGDKGLSFFNPETKKVDYVIMTEKLPVSSFNDGNGLLVAKNGEIFAGSTDGLIMFSENEVRLSGKDMPLFFSALYVNNIKVTPKDDTGILEQIVCYTKQITLNHKQNNLVFTFANNNFGNTASSPFYEYQLEGFDKEWILSDNVHRLTYTNLNPGKYTLKVREVNKYGEKSPKEIQMAIVIRSPFYNTPLAWIIYLLSTAAILYIILSGHQRQLKLKTILEFERREKEHIEELNRFKLDFFTNISHELRTPLTLIITQAEMLLNGKEISKSIGERIEKLYKNAFHMRNLISELLDLHKLEQGQMHLSVSEQNIVPYLNDIYSSFQERAVSQEVQYTFTSSSDSIVCYYDVTQLKKVFFNLLSNAFKFVNKGGTIGLSVIEDADEIVVRITDTGIGIGEADISRIFDRFYQASGKKFNFSSGIGLSLCKDIVKLHDGDISAESKLGYGSVFTVKLKRGMEHFQNASGVEFIQDNEKRLDYESLPDADFMTLIQENTTDISVKNQLKDNKYVILIVEDDNELLSLLSDIFSPLFQVLAATNGMEGWQLAMTHQPDIILSDVMMPEMSGTEMCTKVKNNIKTCHIPVVLLTARTSSEQQIEGLLTGAVDYVMKPFNARILLLKVSTILRNRELLQGAYRKEPESRLELLAGNELDQKVLRKVEEIVEANIEDPEFDVNMLAQQAGIGRSVFFEKMKALTGMTPANFILAYRLKKAAVLLLKCPKLQMNDIASQLGFSSGRYFSRCFKNYFNVTPQQYREHGDAPLE